MLKLYEVTLRAIIAANDPDEAKERATDYGRNSECFETTFVAEFDEKLTFLCKLDRLMDSVYKTYPERVNGLLPVYVAKYGNVELKTFEAMLDGIDRYGDGILDDAE